MTDRWMIVGQDPAPTADDLPLLWRLPNLGDVAKFEACVVPDLMDGDRWCRVTLPPEPEPEACGVKVDGERYRLQPGDPRWIEIFDGPAGWRYCTSASLVAMHAKVAVALGLVPPPVDERVQAVIDAAKAWRATETERAARLALSSLLAAVDALDAAPTPAADDEPKPFGEGPGWFGPIPVVTEPAAEQAPTPAAERLVTCMKCEDEPECPECGYRNDGDRDDLSPPCSWCNGEPCGCIAAERAPAAATAEQWAVEQCFYKRQPDQMRWDVVANAVPIASCLTEQGANTVRDALNGQAWPPMRPMSELPDGHEERVLIATGDGRLRVLSQTERGYDRFYGRLGWWPLPPHPKGGE